MIREILSFGIYIASSGKIDISKPNINIMKKVIIDGEELFEDDEGRLFKRDGKEV